MENKNKSFLFVTAVTDEHLYQDLQNSIMKIVGDKQDVDFLPIYGAKSLTSAYNQAINKPHKYKVYVHQDVEILNPFFFKEVRAIFRNKTVGMIGVAGAKQLPNSCVWWEAKELFGQVEEDRGTRNVLKFAEPKEKYEEVQVIDGLIMITQYDVEWDERIDGFHFYDISHSLHIKEKGCEVVVPKQYSPWCLHKCGNDFDSTQYLKTRDKFKQLYKKHLT